MHGFEGIYLEDHMGNELTEKDKNIIARTKGGIQALRIMQWSMGARNSPGKTTRQNKDVKPITNISSEDLEAL